MSCSASSAATPTSSATPGGLVTEDALRSLSVSQRLLGTEEVVVVMHRDCGMEGADEPGAFDDVEVELRRGLERLRTSSDA